LYLTLTACGGGGTKEEEAPKPTVNVKVGKAEKKTLDVTVSAPATIFPRAQASIASRVTVPIRALRVKKGDTVASGQLLAELDNRDAVAQREDARAQMADADATLQKMQSGTVPADIDRARGQLDVAQAALNQAQKNFDRRSQLFNQGAIPNRDLLQAETDLAQAKTNADVSKRALDLLQNQTTGRDIRSAQARLESAKAKLDLAETQLQFTDIRAPFAGTITDQSMYPGDMANLGSPIFQVMDLSTVTARAQIPDTAAAAVRDGQACTFSPADNATATFSGHISVVNRAVDPQRRTVEAWCEIANGDRKLQANVFGAVTISTGRLSNATVVPVSAVQFNEGTRTGSLLVVDSSMIAHLRNVEAGETVGDIVPILKGVEPGETVVIEGGYGLPDKTQVQVAKAAPESGKGKE
jgi:multidrug efflux pump subunit AcrA (membrane-fusion protein)